MGRLGVDVVEDVDQEPVRAVRSTGATIAANVGLAVVPMTAPQLGTFAAYRGEVMMRATVIVGFVAGSGLG